MCAKLEAELAELSPEDAAEFRKELGAPEGGSERLLGKLMLLLGLVTFSTAGEKETRAWTFYAGSSAPECAGRIHTDFQRGFIKAEIVSFDDLVSNGSMVAAKAAGKVRMEGKEYVMRDGDVVEFRFNV